MSESGLTSVQISAAGAYARAEGLVAGSIPVRAIDPTRRRFQVEDRAATDQAPVDSRSDTDAADADGRSSSSATGGGKAATGWSGGGFGLLGAFTSFLARMFAQGDGAPAASGTAAAQAGAQAYGRATQTAPVADYGNAEILSPSFPRLSSGRALDLSV